MRYIVKSFIMRLKFLIMGLALLCASTVAATGQWEADILGGYERKTIAMPDDYSGKVVATVVKKADMPAGADVALLYVHGYNDYFFQKELGDSAVAHGYSFYAVDLRKYGRSILEGQRMFETKNLEEYFEDIDSALSVVKREGFNRVAIVAHSTGGLISSYYLSKRGADVGNIEALVLNSPFLDMNLSRFQEKVLVPIVSALPFKGIKINQGDSRAYAESLLKRYHGEWDYDTAWKLEVSPAVTSGWIGAIHRAQKHLHRHGGVNVPVLLMHSDNSVYGNEWTPAFNKGDAVLDVNDIHQYAARLGDDVTIVTIEDGLHDLVLSRPDVRAETYATIFTWLEGKHL